MDLGCSFPETKSNALPVFIPIRNLPTTSNSKSPVGKLAPIKVAAKKARRLFISRAPFLPKEKGVRKTELLKKGTEETPEQVLAHEGCEKIGRTAGEVGGDSGFPNRKHFYMATVCSGSPPLQPQHASHPCSASSLPSQGLPSQARPWLTDKDKGQTGPVHFLQLFGGGKEARL